jgi:hypothetical protein
MAHECTSVNTVGTASVGTLCLPVGYPLSIEVPLAAFATYDLTGKYVLLTLSRNGRDLFTYNSTGADISITGGGTADQKIVIAIATASQSAADSAVTLAAVATDREIHEFAIDVKASSGADLGFRIQGDIHWIEKRGNYAD